MGAPGPLPIDDVLDDLRAALAAQGTAVLIAPPGAGKTTRVPLALRDTSWLGNQRIILLEPRRIAARAAADRMASILGEVVGDTVGLRSRLATKVSAKTRIEVVTEGVFTRMILADPELRGIGAVLFDEFHERSLDADFGLALALDSRGALRPDLRLLVMSATLNGARVAALLDGAAMIESAGRAYPVDTRYVGRTPHGRIEDDVAASVVKAVAADAGSILVFLPGQAEIRRVMERLQERLLLHSEIDLVPLHGTLDIAEQRRAIAPAEGGRRKIVLATSIAETSITIDGVTIVIDSGLARVPRFEPAIGVTRLETVRVSRAAADQRRGRAGRTAPGICYRLWKEPENLGLLAYADPEISNADLSGLVLDCADWGAEPLSLRWLDPPSASAVAATRKDLQAIGALDADGRITPLGKRIRALPLPPRLALMLVRAADAGQALAAADLAAVIVERGAGSSDVDLTERLVMFRRDDGQRARDLKRLAKGWAEQAMRTVSSPTPTAPMSPARLLATAFPDRIAKARGETGQFLLANGRAGFVDAKHPLAKLGWLVVAELQGAAAATRITAAVPASFADVEATAGAMLDDEVALSFEPEAMAVRARRVRRLGAIVIASEPLAVKPNRDVATRLADGIAAAGINRLPWTTAQHQLRQRIAFLRGADGDWPDLSDATLAATIHDWLLPFLHGKSRLADITADDLATALDTLLPYPRRRRLEAEAPAHFEAPTGNRFAIDYEGPLAPAVAVRVQELYGLKTHPAIAAGRLPLTLELLSPAQRPIQITRDLPGFWAGSWASVKSDMRGRYPRHLWPDEPASAQPTARAKPRGQ